VKIPEINDGPWERNDFWGAESIGKTWSRLDRIAGKLGALGQVQSEQEIDIQTFVERLRIINKQGEITSLILNRSQEIVFHKLLEAREKRRPARFICLKARQLGISTLIEAYIFGLVTMLRNRFALVVAHDLESATGIFAITNRFLQTPGLPELPRPSRNSSRMLEYEAPHYSRIQIATASNRNLGRGQTLHYIHASEVAFWDKPEDAVLAINQSAPLYWDTLVFWESTANGLQNMFHRTWVSANRGESDMVPIFLSWKDFPFYSLPCAKAEKLDLTPEEKEYQKEYQLSAEQMKWVTRTRVNQCHNSWSKFHQEYPVAPHLAFIFTGMPWFNTLIIQRALEDISKPPQLKGFLSLKSETRVEPVFKSDEAGPLEVWKKPEKELTYSLGMDVGEGVGGDYTVIQVICNETREVVARLRTNRTRAESAGVDAYLLGAWYNYGLLGIERNGPGLATLTVCERGLAEYPQLSGYPNLYYHTYTDRKIPEQTRRLGWITDRRSKEAMLNRLARVVEEEELTIYAKGTLLEMQGFVWDAEKKAFRQNYKAPESRLPHDDDIMALAIANEMRTATWESRFIKGSLPEDGDF
jgi:hypothetical protein